MNIVRFGKLTAALAFVGIAGMLMVGCSHNDDAGGPAGGDPAQAAKAAQTRAADMQKLGQQAGQAGKK